MSLEHSPARAGEGPVSSGAGPSPEPAQDRAADLAFWQSLIDERSAATFLDVSPRTLQQWRQNGNGPRYLVLSTRCLRYKRAWLKDWADARSASSTAEYGDAE